MPGRDGTELAAELRTRTPAPAVVFVTAHPEHALQAFDLDAVDYLTKPVKRERLQAALRRVAQRLGSPIKPGGAVKMDDDGPVIVVSDRGRIIRVPVADVLYMKAELKYVTLRTPSTPTSSTTRSPSSPSGSATASCASTATRSSPSAPCARSSAPRSRPTTTTAPRPGASASPGQRVARRLASPGRRGARALVVPDRH
jgi:hypothetical protein